MIIPISYWRNQGALPFSASTVSNLRAWYKADVGITLNVTTVSQWNDQSGGGNHLIGTSTAQPLYVASSLNGLPTILFDGINDSLRMASPITGFTNVTYFIVIKRNSSALGVSIGGDANNYHYGNDSTTLYSGFNSKAGTTTTSTWYVRSGTGTGSVATWYSDGVLLTSHSQFGQFNAFQSVGDWNGTYFTSGNIAEVLIYDKVLNSTERGVVDVYLRAKWATY